MFLNCSGSISTMPGMANKWHARQAWHRENFKCEKKYEN